MRAFLCLALATVVLANVRYDDFNVVRVHESHKKLDNLLEGLCRDSTCIDVFDQQWNHADVFVDSAQLDLLTKLGLNFTVINDHVQADIDAELVASGDSWFESYHDFDDIYEWFKELAEDNPRVVFHTIGKTREGRDIPGLTITIGERGHDKPAIWINGLQHAREWISGAVLQYLALQLATTEEPRYVDLLSEIKFVIAPVMNPDGYQFSRDSTRMWRKNRRNNGNNVFGVDLNRNWDDHWGQGGSSTNPSSDVYMGPSPASEPEIQAAVDFFFKHNVIASIDYHSYTQLVLRPYGWSRADPPHEALLRAAGDGLRDNIRDIHGRTYTSQKSIDLYLTTGTASDWFYGDNVNEELGHRTYGICIELRPPTANPGFVLPPGEIIPSGEEQWPPLMEFARFAVNNPL